VSSLTFAWRRHEKAELSEPVSESTDGIARDRELTATRTENPNLIGEKHGCED
jgi:hypothetical protein